MSGDIASSIVEERPTSVMLESNIENFQKAEMVMIAPPTNDVPVQYKNVSGYFDFNITVII